MDNGVKFFILMMYFPRTPLYQPFCVARLWCKGTSSSPMFPLRILSTYASRFAVQRYAQAPIIGTGTVFDPLAFATRRSLTRFPKSHKARAKAATTRSLDMLLSSPLAQRIARTPPCTRHSERRASRIVYSNTRWVSLSPIQVNPNRR